MTKALRALALSCLLFAVPAWGRILVVDMAPLQSNITDGEYDDIQVKKQSERLRAGTLDALDRIGADYALVPGYACSTSVLRTGIMVWNRGTSGRREEQFDAVIVLDPTRRQPAGTEAWFPFAYTKCNPCSLTIKGALSAATASGGWVNSGWPQIPNLWIGIGQNGNSTVGWGNVDAWLSSATCSTSVATAGNAPYATVSGKTLTAGGAAPGTVESKVNGATWLSAANIGAFPHVSTAGGYRTILGARASMILGPQANYSYPPINADSLVADAGAADTSLVWERTFTGINAVNRDGNTVAVQPIVFANVMGASPCSDSVASANPTVGGNLGFNRPCEFDATVLMAALARLDSLTSGGVFKKPLKASIVISGGFERTIRRLPGGSNNDDSVTVKACIDSLKTLGVPLTVTVNVDSIASYPNEVAWWTGLGTARFAPIATTGVKDTTTASGAWSSSVPVDIFGRYRARTFYVLNDSSVYGGLKAAQTLAKAAGFTRLSKTVIAPLDDWTPKNMRWTQNAYDSLLYAFRKAGYSAVLTDVQRPEGSILRIPAASRDLARGWYGKEERVRLRYEQGETFSVVGHTGFNTSGSAFQLQKVKTEGVLDSTSVPYTYSFGSNFLSTPPASHRAIGRFWSGLVHNTWRDYDWQQDDVASKGYSDVRVPYADVLYDCRRASVFKLHVSDFGGNPSGPPARPGWWAVKSVAQQFKSFNAIAGRTVASIVYPEELEP